MENIHIRILHFENVFAVILNIDNLHQSNLNPNGAFNCKMISCKMSITIHDANGILYYEYIFWFSSLQRKFIEFEMEFEMEWFQC